MDYRIFTEKWLERAERSGVAVDDGDRFIALWVSFNGWMKLRFGEEESDRDLIRALKQLDELATVFISLQKSDAEFAMWLSDLQGVRVCDMRWPEDLGQAKVYDGSFESLVDALYRIRCNLFHGRKDIDDDRKDYDLVCLGYRILMRIFKQFLNQYGL